MPFNFAQPAQMLLPFVKQYWALDNVMPRGLTHTQRIIPTGLIELTIYLGDKPLSSDRDQLSSDPSLISGQQNTSYNLVVTGSVSLFSVTFHPPGAQVFFKVPMEELYNQTLSLRVIQKEFVDQIESELYEAQSFSQRVGIMNHFLGLLLQKNGRLEPQPRLIDSLMIIDHSMGMVDIVTLANKACLSRKQYERIFKTNVGISPKRFLRIIRLQHALFKKQLTPNLSLTELAYDCGYYDQSHMINDFNLLTGMAPRQYFSACDAYSDYFLL
ncbi:MAG: AraC family transcriptional regulator [Candidatus Marinimicrobia bacterium]|nr:AraC family transcriptional regulator [Candidatus Neomarinimicrobiota bacterium]